MEPFTLIEETPPDSGPYRLFPDLLHLTSAPTADHDLHFAAALRAAFPETIVTAIPATNTPLRAFAAAGLASCVVDKDTDAYASWRGYRPPSHRAAKGSLAEAVDFAKYRYVWQGQAFILYCVGAVQYVLKERGEGEHALGPSGATDALILAVGEYVSSITEIVWVYDGYWRQSRGLWEEVRKASWEDVILEEGQKRELREVTGRFFDSRGRYEELGVPWKRGVIFHGPPGEFGGPLSI